MLDEPPLIVRMRTLAGFMDDPSVILQSERSQFRESGLVIRVKNTSNPQTFRDLDEHRGVFDIDFLPGWRLGDVQRNVVHAWKPGRWAVQQARQFPAVTLLGQVSPGRANLFAAEQFRSHWWLVAGVLLCQASSAETRSQMDQGPENPLAAHPHS